MQGSRRDPLGLAHPGWVFAATAFAILLVDQVTKGLVRSQFPERAASIDLIPHVIRLTSVRNTGAAFGLFPGRQPVFILTSLLVLFVIAAYMRRARPTAWPVVIALSMVAAGALGNLIDRALVGRVTDFLEFSFVNFPVFNIADIGIVGGVGVLMAWILFGPEGRETVTEDTEDSEESASEDTGVAELADAEDAPGSDGTALGADDPASVSDAESTL